MVYQYNICVGRIISFFFFFFFRTLAEAKVEIEINRFVIEPAVSRKPFLLFMDPRRRIRADLDPSRLEFAKQIYTVDGQKRKSVAGEIYTTHRTYPPFKFRSIEKCCFARIRFSLSLSLFLQIPAAFLSDWSHQDEAPGRLSPPFAPPYFCTLYLFLFYFILGVKLSARDSVVIIKVFFFFQLPRIFFWIAQLWMSHVTVKDQEKSHHVSLPYYLFSMIRNIFQDKTIIFYSTVSLSV